MRRFVVGLAIGIATFAPSWTFADDEQIAKTIVEKLEARKKDGQLKGFNIDLKVDKGTVWLTGHVASTEQQQLALDIARHAPDVEAVVNDLKVKRQESPARAADARRTAASDTSSRPSLLGRWFGSSPASSASPTPATKFDAKVKAVAHESESAVEPSAPTPIKAATPIASGNEALIEVLSERLGSLKDSGALKDFDIDLTAAEGIITVTGEAASMEQRNLILDTIRRTPGVTQVVTHLKAPGQIAVTEPTPARAKQAKEIGSGVIPAFDSRDAAAMGTGVARTAAPPEAPGPIPMPVADVGPAPAARPAGVSVGGYTAIPVNVMPAPFNPGQVSPLQPNSPHLAQRPLAFAPATGGPAMASNMQPVASMPAHLPGPGIGIAPARFDHPNMPGYAWPSYAAHPNYAAVTYPKQYSPSAWPYIGPFYPYPQVPLGWRKVTMEWDDGWWYLDFKGK